jgi:phage gp46-like protein
MTTALVDRDTGEVYDVEGTALESRAGLIPLEALHTARRQLLITLAPLKALHGPFGIWDDRRKQMLESLKVRSRLTLLEQGQKITEGLVDAMAYADEAYLRLLDQAERDKIEYLMQANQMSELEEKIRDREICLLAYNSELKLTR